MGIEKAKAHGEGSAGFCMEEKISVLRLIGLQEHKA
jgi:hypothetical protein